MTTKTLWVLVGGNGAGKTTYYDRYLKPKGLAFINADLIAKKVFARDDLRASYKAAQIAEKMREDLITEGRSFCFETVFSHPSKIDFIARAKAFGYQINLIFIHLETDALNALRVKGRVVQGGHDVPLDKIKQRIPRAMANVKKAIALADNVVAYDNSSLKRPYRKALILKNGEVKFESTDFSWVTWLLRG